MAKLIEFTELAHSAPVHINADNVKAVRDNPASPGSTTVEMMDGKVIYVTGKHVDRVESLSCARLLDFAGNCGHSWL